MGQDKKVAPYFKDACIETVLADVNEALAPLESQLMLGSTTRDILLS